MQKEQATKENTFYTLKEIAKLIRIDEDEAMFYTNPRGKNPLKALVEPVTWIKKDHRDVRLYDYQGLEQFIKVGLLSRDLGRVTILNYLNSEEPTLEAVIQKCQELHFNKRIFWYSLLRAN